jgi:hypothetical protein
MKVTRRRLLGGLEIGLARVLVATAALPAGVSAQVPSSAPPSDALASAARDEFHEAGRALSAVKLPRFVEPATRFEA